MSSTFDVDRYRRELDSLQFSDDALKHMTTRLEDAAAQMGVDAIASDDAGDASNILQLPPSRAARAPFRRPASQANRPAHRILRIAASVAIAAGLGLGATGAYAAATQRSLSAVFSDIFGGAPAQTEIINKIGHPIGASATSNGVTVTADAVIGSPNSCTMVFSIARDDDTPLKDLKPAADGTYPLLWKAIEIRIDGVRDMGGGAYFYDADPDDNSVQYVFTINNATASDGSGIAGRTARVHLSDLLLATERPDDTEVIAEGSWDLKFQLDYEDSSVVLPAGQRLGLDGMAVTVNKLAVSPVGASITYAVDAVSAESDDPNELPADRFTRLPFTVTFRDGRTVDGTDADASARERDGHTIIVKSFVFDTIVNVDDIVSVTIGDQTVPVP